MGVMGHYGMMDHRGPWMMGTDMPSHGGHMGTRYNNSQQCTCNIYITKCI